MQKLVEGNQARAVEGDELQRRTRVSKFFNWDSLHRRLGLEKIRKQMKSIT